ncbi:MAG: hypothetical protein K6G55_06030 [Selenomonadaceae bacterium]|nr:hypothetical protein [Selenomonadaceae bacterium]
MKKFFLIFAVIFTVVVTSTARAAEFDMIEYSAQIKLQWLKEAGVPEAKKFLKLLNRPVFFSAQNLNDYERIRLTNALFQEMNLAAGLEYVRYNDYNNIYDLACSLSPRAMLLGDEGRRVIVGELATVALIGDWFIYDLGGKSKDIVDYETIPVQDRVAMMQYAHKFKGAVCVIEQGLMIYLNAYDRDSMFDNIRDVLKEHGGCLITSDFVQQKYFKDVAAALYGESEAEIIYKETKEMYEKVYGEKLNDDSLQDEDSAMKYLESHGLHAEKIPLFHEAPKLNVKSQLTPEQIERVNKVAAKNYLWVITAIQ